MFLCSTYLLNASSREERQKWMTTVKKCQVALSPKASPKSSRKPIASNDTSAGGTRDTKTSDSERKVSDSEIKVTEKPSKNSDQADSDSSGDGSRMLHYNTRLHITAVIETPCVQSIHTFSFSLVLSATTSSPSPTKYPNTGRRETGVAAALMPMNYDNDDDDNNEAACTSFSGPYADSDDDIGNAILHDISTMVQ